MQVVEELRSHGYTVRKQGRTWGASACPSCGPASEHSNKLCAFVGKDGKERWNCHACGARGDLADLISMVHGIPLADALKRLRNPGSRGDMATQNQPAPTEKRYFGASHEEDATVDVSFTREVVTDMVHTLPMWEPDAGQYLMSRGISKEIIVQACHRGIIRMLPTNPHQARDLLIKAAKGADRLMKAGLWAGKSDKWPANAFRPLIFIAGGNTTIEFRNIHKESRYPKSIRLGHLTKPYVWRGDVKRVVVVEGVIDMLSLVQMGEKRTIMAIPGVNAWRPSWFTAAHQAYGSSFTIAVDDDKAGNLVAKSMIEMLTENGIESDRLVPAEGKDWNDLLQAQPALH